MWNCKSEKTAVVNWEKCAAQLLSFGVCSIDSLLNSGVHSCEITEVVGPAAAGKTQVGTNTFVTNNGILL